MKEEIKEIREKFNKIVKMGYVKSINNNSSGIGRTFETLLGLNENPFAIADYKGIEIKARRAYSKSYINLFTSVPDGDGFLEIERIKNLYGYPCKTDRNYKVLYAAVYGNTITSAGVKYAYKIEVDRKNEKIYLCIYNSAEELIEKEVSWSFELLKERINNKVKNLAIINAWPNSKNGNNYYKYYKLKFYTIKDFETFLSLIENGTIKIIIKIGIYVDEKRYGNTYDHGTSFTIREEDIKKLYYEIDEKH